MIRAVLGAAALMLALAVVVLSAANRQPVTLTLDPFGSDPALALTAPLYAWLFGAVALGVVLGALSRFAARRKREK
ncbi:hypothetical protein RDV64_11155 [Acuticoccus sp. MNP-M23]|uniref:hypothetical protein n=1 Tax=Acuticoccus sp. MNP-M23 TaxID=3072793 RepID=UPI0028161F77|nr:hypothetical protein [Acuticoccus sp. MNP-M23]WMS44905.1 hypothetical protein RDV64_11155 [Acuticoccus sp. MNP-M23]